VDDIDRGRLTAQRGGVGGRTAGGVVPPPLLPPRTCCPRGGAHGFVPPILFDLCACVQLLRGGAHARPRPHK